MSTPLLATRRARCLLVGLSAAVAHLPALGNGFVLDDDQLLTANPYIHDGRGLLFMLRSPLFTAAGDPHRSDFYRPLSALLNWCSYQVLGTSAPAQHALNLAMHVAVAVALLLVFEAYAVSPRVALAIACLFAVHPATPEIVAYIGGRQDMLGWIAALAALALVPRTRRPSALAALSGAALVLATFSRESFVVLGAVLPIAAALTADERPLQRGLASAAGAAAGMAVVLVLRHAAHLGAVPAVGAGFAAWAGFSGGVVLRFAKDAFAPTDLAPLLTPAPVPAWLGCLLVGAVAATAAIPLRVVGRGPARALAVSGSIGVTASVFAHAVIAIRTRSFSDRYAYTFLVWGACAAAPLVDRVVGAVARRAADSKLLRLAPAGAALLCVVLLPLTWARDRTWHDETRLALGMYAARPHDPQSDVAMGIVLAEHGDYDDAYPLCRAYADAFPESTRPDSCVANYYLAKHDYPAAIAVLRHYLARHPHDANALAALRAAEAPHPR
jgi:hypothetical protein